jgi:hypothetical protein
MFDIKLNQLFAIVKSQQLTNIHEGGGFDEVQISSCRKEYHEHICPYSNNESCS